MVHYSYRTYFSQPLHPPSKSFFIFFFFQLFFFQPPQDIDMGPLSCSYLEHRDFQKGEYVRWVISWTQNGSTSLAPQSQQLTVGDVGLFFIIGVKFTRKSPQNAFNVGYRFQFWKVSERCKAMDPFPHTGIYLQKMELQWMMSFSSQTIRIPLNHNFFFFLCMSHE